MLLWLGEKIRPTKDIDLLGFGDTSAEELKRVFTALCKQKAIGDGLDFLAQTVQVEAIRARQEYGGMRVTLTPGWETSRSRSKWTSVQAMPSSLRLRSSTTQGSSICRAHAFAPTDRKHQLRKNVRRWCGWRRPTVG